jgi:capsular polysaccharide biosynthesis protein
MRTFELRSLPGLLRRSRTLLLVAPLLGAALAAAMSALVPPRYEAETVLRVGLTGQMPTLNMVPIESGAALAERIKAPAFREELSARTGVEIGTAALPLRNQMRVRLLTGTQLVEIVVQSPDPETARLIAEGAVAQVREQHERETESSRGIYQGMIATRQQEVIALEEQLAALGSTRAQATDAARAARGESVFVSNLIASTRKRLAEVEQELGLFESVLALPRTHPTQALAKPSVDARAARRNHSVAAVVGFFAGLLLALLIALLRAPRA